MKLGDKSVIYQHGSIAEKNDHLNTLSLIYKGIQMTYGMSIDYLGYKHIDKSYIQRGGTLITRKTDGEVIIKMVPLGAVVSTRVSGVKEGKNNAEE